MAQNDVVIKLSLDGASQASKGLAEVGDSASSTDSKLGSLISGGLKGAGVALAGLATSAVTAGGLLVASSVKSYASFEQNWGGIETLFGDAKGKMLEYANEAYRTAGVSANAYMEQVTSFSASLLQGLEGDTARASEVANQAMIDMADNANKFGTSIELIQNAYQGFSKQNYTMLDNLKLGYGGTASEMARLINDSGVLGDTMTVTAKTVNDVSFDKVIEAIHVMQEEMGVAGTTAREATETISGSVGLLQGAWENFLVGLADPSASVDTLAGQVVEALNTVIGNVVPVVDNIASVMGTLAPSIGDSLSSVVEAIATAIPGLLQTGVGLINGLVQGINSALPMLIQTATPIVTDLVSALATQAPLFLDAGLKALVAFGSGIAEALPTLLPLATQTVTDLALTLVENAPLLFETAVELVLALSEGILESIPVLIEALPALIEGIINFLVESIPALMEGAIQLFDGLIQALPQIIEALVVALPQIITAITTFFANNVPLIVNSGVSLLTALIQNLPLIITTIVGAIPQIITAVIGALASSIPQIVQSGFSLLTSLITNLPGIISTVVSSIPQIVGSLVSSITGSIGSIASAGFDLLTGMVQKLPSIISDIVGKIPQIITGIAGAIGNGASAIWDAGYNLITGMWDGISSAGSWLYGKVMGWASSLLDGVKAFFGIASPSRVFRDQIGKMIPAGLAIGIDMDSEKATKAITKLNRSVLAEASSLPSLTSSNELVFNAPSPSAVSPSVLPTTTAVAQQPIVSRGENVSNVYNITVSVDPSSVEELQTVQEFIDRSAQWAVVL